jgi:pimeloyl-ACP methyl ester carboxylesterase
MKTLKNYSALVIVSLIVSNASLLNGQEISVFTLNNNNKLSYAEFGNLDGEPVFYFHGFPGSHEDISLFHGDSLATKLNIRLIAVNRPGYYMSNPVKDYTLIQWARDLEELAAHLELEKFSILAYSGGAPFALACAYECPDRLDKVAIVSGMGPAKAPKAKRGAAMIIPKAPKLIMKGMSAMLEEDPDKFKANMSKNLPAPDMEVHNIPLFGDNMMNTMKTGLEYGNEGAIQDARIYKKKWGFELNNINTEIMLWHGVQDKNVPIETAGYVAENLQNCEYKFFNGEAHLSLIYNHTEDILSSLTNNSE